MKQTNLSSPRRNADRLGLRGAQCFTTRFPVPRAAGLFRQADERALAGHLRPLYFAYLLAPSSTFSTEVYPKGLPKVKSSLVRAEHPRHVDLRHRPHLHDVPASSSPSWSTARRRTATTLKAVIKPSTTGSTAFVENQTILLRRDIYSDQLLSALNGYYDKLVKWVTGTVIPQAQVAIVSP